MRVSENTLKWLMRCYPPLLFQRIWVLGFTPGFRGVKVRINKSIFNKNYNGSIFGGTIFAAADPFYPVLFHQILNADGKRRLIVWSKSAKIDFMKPAISSLFFEIDISDENIAEAEESMLATGKYERIYPIIIYNKTGEICAEVSIEVYVRDLDLSKTLV